MNNTKLYELTRSSGFLWKTSLVAVLSFVAIASIHWSMKPTSNNLSYDDLYLVTEDGETEIAINTEKHGQALQAELLNNGSLVEKLHALKYLLTISRPTALVQLPAAKDIPGISEQEISILAAFIQAFRSPQNIASSQLLQLSETVPPPQYAHYALSLFYSTYSDSANAIRSAKAEIAYHPSTQASQLLLDIYRRNQLYQAIKDLQSDPLFEPLIDPFLQRDIALQSMNWPVLLSTLLPVAYYDTPFSMIALALLAGAAWAALLLRFHGELSWSSPVVHLAIPALLLGALSAHLTILVIYYQENQLELSSGNDLVSQAIYSVAGIGLREELLKLLCFVPLIPLLVKRGNEMEILIIGSLVGLGFAIEENISYFENSQGVAAFGRFLTANFFHSALTGICGLTLTQAFMYRGAAINTAVSTFGLAVLAHGAYDAFIIIPELANYSIATFIVFILVSYQFFNWIRHLRVKWNDPISLTAQFTFSLVLVFGSSYFLVSLEMGPIEALMELTQEAIGLALLLLMFYREIPEEIV